MKRYFYFLIIILVLAIGGVFYRKLTSNPVPTPISTNSTTLVSQTKISALDFPIDRFKERITKKPFGIYVSPTNSPVSPEIFTGYHTGLDVEYQDIITDVPVYAINNGEITLSETASGYGGVFILNTTINGTKHSVLYGHIRPATLPKVGASFQKGDKISLLGTGYSQETDYERRNLHFAVLSNERLDIKGYISRESGLSDWLDPLSLY